MPNYSPQPGTQLFEFFQFIQQQGLDTDFALAFNPIFISLSMHIGSDLDFFFKMCDLHEHFTVFLKSVDDINYIVHHYNALPASIGPTNLTYIPYQVKAGLISLSNDLATLNDHLQSLHPYNLDALANQDPKLINFINRLTLTGIGSEFEFPPITTRGILESDTLRAVISICTQYVEKYSNPYE